MTLDKKSIFQHQYQKQVKMYISFFYFMIDFLWEGGGGVFTYTISFSSLTLWEINSKRQISILELIKKRSKIREKNMSWERALVFYQWKTFSENYKPMAVWLWIIYKLTQNYCGLRLFSKFIETQKRYPTSLDEIVVISS